MQMAASTYDSRVSLGLELEGTEKHWLIEH